MKNDKKYDSIVHNIVMFGASDLLKNSMQYFMEVEWEDKYKLMRSSFLAITARAKIRLEEWIAEDEERNKNNPAK